MSGGDDKRTEKRGAGLLTGDYNARKKQKTIDSEKFPKANNQMSENNNTPAFFQQVGIMVKKRGRNFHVQKTPEI